MLMAAVDRYVALRRATGFSFENGESHLRSFARFAEERGEKHVVAASAIAWAEGTSMQNARHRRLRTVRLFARFVHAEDARHEIPPDGVFAGQHRRQTPYIFTSEELGLLVEHAARLGPASSLRPLVYSTLFGLLAATGMRVGEALALENEDFRDGVLHIRRTKFHKSRMVPLHPTVERALSNYVKRRARVAASTSHIFVSLRRERLSYASVIETFHEVCHAAQLPRQPGKRCLRLHDLRHTFAVRALEAAPDDRDRITQHLLALTTYMGHARVASTYWYLESTPTLMADIADRCEEMTHGGPR